MMGSFPNQYFKYYYFRDEILRGLKKKPTTRSQDIMAEVPGYWEHYREQADTSGRSKLDPNRSRGGIHELELAIDAMDAIFNDRGERMYCNIPNNGAIIDFPDDMVIERPARLAKGGLVAEDRPTLRMPRHVAGLVKALGEYQYLTAKAAWSGNRLDAIRALASNPLVLSLTKAEAIYDDMSAALKDFLPERLLT